MKLSEVVELVENHPDLHPYLDKILKKNKKTQVSYLESLNRLVYLLYLDDQKEMAKELLDRIIQVPFEGNYNTWTFVDSSLVLLAYLESEMERRLLYLTDLLKIHLFIAELSLKRQISRKKSKRIWRY